MNEIQQKRGKYFENVPFSDLKIGQSASLSRLLTKADICLFAQASGDMNPAHMNEAYARNDIFHGIVGHGMWSASLISSVLGNILPGPGTILLENNIRFKKPVRPGDTVTATVTVKDKDFDHSIVSFNCHCINQNDEVIAEGNAKVLAPVEKDRIEVNEKLCDMDTLDETISSCCAMPSLKTAIVHPVKPHIIKAIQEAVNENLIDPVLIGPEHRIRKAAEEANISLDAWEIINTEHSHAAANRAVEMAATGHVQALMKGALHTDELLKAVIKKESGLRTEKRLSHVYLMRLPTYHKPIMVTDAAVNILPDLEVKVSICQNAINLWHVVFGDKEKPKVALLAAVETVNQKMPATTDAASLCKMADRGQITNAILDGPLALDVAISTEAAQEKGIISKVAGDADILVAPDIEAANAIAKQMTFLGHAEAAGIIMGARVPIILTSRSDSAKSRLLSCALAIKVAAARQEGRIK